MQLNQAGLNPNQTETTSTVIPVGTSVQQVALNNPTRLSGLFINISSNSIFLNINANVGISSGIELTPNGGSFGVSQWADYGLAGFSFYAIATAGGSNLLFIETNINNL